jgi:formylmethanofuran dehydrogenase subunit C
MRGGTIIVDGNAGNEIGLNMQQGLIAIVGEAGDMLGFNMTDGMVIVLGNSGIRPGAGMHGGLIALMGRMPPPLLPSFRFDRTGQPEKAAAVLRDLRGKGSRMDESLLATEVDIFVGDLVAEGTGEIYLRHNSAS